MTDLRLKESFSPGSSSLYSAAPQTFVWSTKLLCLLYNGIYLCLILHAQRTTIRTDKQMQMLCAYIFILSLASYTYCNDPWRYQRMEATVKAMKQKAG